MPLQSQQIVALATQIAKVPGYTSQAGEMLNYILSELCQTYDFELARKTYNFNFTGSQGPYNMPPDYLRAGRSDIFYLVQVGLPYFMEWSGKAEFDRFIQFPTLSAYPTRYWVDMSATPPQMYVWPMPSGAYPVTVSYYSQMPDIATPETSTSVPWFPDQNYLTTRLAGELMKIADDARCGQFLGDSDGTDGQIEGCQSLLRKFLIMKDDADNEIKQVTLDRRRFGRTNSGGDSKSMDWGVASRGNQLP